MKMEKPTIHVLKQHTLCKEEIELIRQFEYESKGIERVLEARKVRDDKYRSMLNMIIEDEKRKRNACKEVNNAEETEVRRG